MQKKTKKSPSNLAAYKKVMKIINNSGLNENLIFNQDCIEGAKKYIADESVNLIICDPPFGIKESTFGSQYARDSGNILAGYKEAPPEYSKFSYDWMEQCKRTLKKNGSMYIVSGFTNLAHILNAIKALDLKLVNHLIWKYNFGVYTTRKYVTAHYHLLYITKQKAKPTFNNTCRFNLSQKDNKGGSLLDQDMESVWDIPREFHKNTIKNLNKLPAALIQKMIQYSSNEGDLVCDFFLGNFTTAFAAKSLGRKFSGFEINPAAYNYFIEQYNEAEFGDRLFNSEEDIRIKNWKILQDQLFT